MSLSEKETRTLQYLRQNDLDQLIDLDNLPSKIVSSLNDLVRLHKLVREQKSFTILEFGVGFSTIVMADALQKNEEEWNQFNEQKVQRNRFPFQLFSVDASVKWIEHAKDMMPASLLPRIHLSFSEVKIGTYCGQLCHYYTNLPDIVPDFVYLDGPDPKDVQGDVNGLSFGCEERTVMAADLLLMEPTLLPGSTILVDGRTNNARFLCNNFRRDWDMDWKKNDDITIFELNERPLGVDELIE